MIEWRVIDKFIFIIVWIIVVLLVNWEMILLVLSFVKNEGGRDSKCVYIWFLILVLICLLS